jgi:hypothetical protein
LFFETAWIGAKSGRLCLDGIKLAVEHPAALTNPPLRGDFDLVLPAPNVKRCKKRGGGLFNPDRFP